MANGDGRVVTGPRAGRHEMADGLRDAAREHNHAAERLEKKGETTALAPLTFIPAKITGWAPGYR